MYNFNAMKAGKLPYEAPVMETVDLTVDSVLCTSGGEYDFNNSIGDLDSRDFGEF